MELLEQVELMVRAASMYYMDNITQNAIAKQMGISRATVVRLLQRALEEGIVEIRVNTHPDLRLPLEQALREQFQLDHVHLVMDQSDESQQRGAVARAAADVLLRLLRDDMVVAMGMGRNVGAICQHAQSVRKHDRVTFVSANGGLNASGKLINPNDTCRCLADRVGGEVVPLMAPAFTESSELQMTLLAHDQIQSALDVARRSDLAFVGVGDVHEHSVDVLLGAIPVEDMRRLKQNKAVGDILGAFYDIDGNMIQDGILDRVIALSTDDLRRIPTVIAVASEPTKAAALLGGLRTGLLNGLITTIQNARSILSLAHQQHLLADH